MIYHPGDILGSRYIIIGTLGEGTFGKVAHCRHKYNGDKSAVKIIKNVDKYRYSAKIEIRILESISKSSAEGKRLCVRMLDWFDHNGHICIVFELLGLSVFDFLKDNDYEPYPLEQVREISFQLIKSVKFLHEQRFTHTDLKPENVMFESSDCLERFSKRSKRTVNILKSTNIKLIDFGSATHDEEHHSTIVSTRHYRGPEVLLELGWSHPCDMWSIGTIIFELYRGHTLFQTHDNREHLAMMERILGPFPRRMIESTRKEKYFYRGRVEWDDRSSEGKYVREHCYNLKRYQMGKSHEEDLLFDLVARLLEYLPDKRLSASEAIQHPFFSPLPSALRSDCRKNEAPYFSDLD